MRPMKHDWQKLEEERQTRMMKIIEDFLTDLAEWIKERKELKCQKLYNKHPKCRVGLRRALYVLQKRGTVTEEQINNCKVSK